MGGNHVRFPVKAEDRLREELSILAHGLFSKLSVDRSTAYIYTRGETSTSSSSSSGGGSGGGGGGGQCF